MCWFELFFGFGGDVFFLVRLFEYLFYWVVVLLFMEEDVLFNVNSDIRFSFKVVENLDWLYVGVEGVEFFFFGEVVVDFYFNWFKFYIGINWYELYFRYNLVIEVLLYDFSF